MAAEIKPRSWLIWLTPESHDELRALLKPFDADQFFATPKPIPPRSKKS